MDDDRVGRHQVLHDQVERLLPLRFVAVAVAAVVTRVVVVVVGGNGATDQGSEFEGRVQASEHVHVDLVEIREGKLLEARHQQQLLVLFRLLASHRQANIVHQQRLEKCKRERAVEAMDVGGGGCMRVCVRLGEGGYADGLRESHFEKYTPDRRTAYQLPSPM